jgi:hypothetical protein
MSRYTIKPLSVPMRPLLLATKRHVARCGCERVNGQLVRPCGKHAQGKE